MGVDATVSVSSRDVADAIAAAKPTLSLIATRLCATPADAADLVQDTVERAMRQGISADVRNPRAWLATIMHNLFIDRCRAQRRLPVHESLDESHGESVDLFDPVDEPAWSRATLDDVKSALAQIEPMFADVYRRHTFDHQSYEQIATALRIERVTVGTRLNRARKMLRKVLVARLGISEVAS